MKGYVLTLAVLLACSCAWSADAGGADFNREDTTVVSVQGNTATTTVEVKDGGVVVRNSAGEVAAKPGETIVVNGQNVVRQSNQVVRNSSFSKVTINGKTIEVSSDDSGNTQVSSNNGQITIQCDKMVLTGDINMLKAGDKTYDISGSDTVKITVKGGQVEVDTAGGKKQE